MVTPLVTDLIALHYPGRPLPAESIGQHLHHYFQLDVVLEGRIEVTVEKARPQILRGGDAILVAPLVRHGYETYRGWRQATFKFQLAPNFWRWTGGGVARGHLPQPLIEVVEAAGKNWHEKNPLHQERLLATLTLCLVELLKKKKQPLSVEWTEPFRLHIWRLLEQIMAQPHGDWQVEKMARECHLSTDRFSRCFHKMIGQPPRRFVLETRLRAAASELLAQPQKPIKMIAEQAGYTSVHSFTRSFTQVFGTAPGAYRMSRPRM